MDQAPAIVDAATNSVNGLLNFLPAVAALGAGSMAVVDASKVFFGGPSNFGFDHIRKGVMPFLSAAGGASDVFGPTEAVQTLKANWLNGVAKSDQKAIARALIHLGLTQGNAPALAMAAGVDAAALGRVAANVAAGTAPASADVNVLGQFDVVLNAVLDAAYERADQKYRNACKFLSMCVSTALSVLAGLLLYGFGREQVGISVLVGLSATPLAPVSKDLATSLQSAVAALRAVRR